MKSAWAFVFFPTLLAVSESISTIPNDFRKSDSCSCGMTEETAPRIVGGKMAEPNSYPWMVLIFYSGMMHCGGSLINDRYILTAGHCLFMVDVENLSAFLGVHDKSVSENELEKMRVELESLILHDDFQGRDLYDENDIGMIRLKDPVKFTSTVKPICLPEPGNDFSGSLATVTGWGKVGESKESPSVLKETEVEVLTTEECKKKQLIGEYINPSMICAIGNMTDACQGDSGGPLFLKPENGPAKQIGLVSWGIGCAEPNVPGVYTRVSNYLKWIIQNTADATYCKTP